MIEYFGNNPFLVGIIGFLIGAVGGTIYGLTNNKI